MAIQDINEAKSIVANYVDSEDFTIEILLESSKGNNYRPWYVAALEIKNKYENIVRADIATFQYDKNAAKNLLDTQAKIDSTDSGVVSPWTVDELLAEIDGYGSISVNIH